MLVNKTIPVDSSFLYDFFTKKEEVIGEENKIDHKGLIVAEGVEKLFLFEKDLISGNKKFHFMTVPKFGSVLAFRLTIPTYNNSESFTDQLAKIKQYHIDQKELEEIKSNDEKLFAMKVEEMIKNNEDTSEFMEAFREKIYSPVEIVAPVAETKHYLLVFDNIGEDTPISEEKLLQIIKNCMHIRKCWLDKNLEKLNSDVAAFVEITEKTDSSRFSEFEKEVELFMTNQKKTLEIQIKEEAATPKNGSNSPNNILFNSAVEVLNFWTQKLLEQLDELRELEKFNFIKYAEIFQLFFFNLGLSKNDLNFEGTNLLDWKKCQDNFHLVQIEKIESYQYDVTKPESFKPYQLCNVIYDKLNAMNWPEVAAHSFPLYVLGNYLLNLMKTRIENINLRKAEYALKVEFRQKQIEMVKERLDKKKTELDADKLKFYNSETENIEVNENNEEETPKVSNEFKENEWVIEWESRNPEIEIPEEPVLDIDNDISSDYGFSEIK